MSSVIIINDVPEGCRDSDIHRALLMYGTATDIAIHQMGNGQRARAVVTMRSVQEAQAVLQQRSVSIQGSLVPVVSGTAPGGAPVNGNSMMMRPQQPNMLQQNMHHQQQQMMSGGNAMQRPYSSPGANPYEMAGQGYGSMGSASAPNNRLHVVVENCRYPITREVLTQMFSMVAPPVSVYCGPTGPVTTGSVEYADAATAAQALQRFNNSHIYPECCLLRLNYEPQQQQQQQQLPQQHHHHHLPPPSQHQQQQGMPPQQQGMPPQQQAMPPQQQDNNRGGYGNQGVAYDPYASMQAHQQGQDMHMSNYMAQPTPMHQQQYGGMPMMQQQQQQQQPPVMRGGRGGMRGGSGGRGAGLGRGGYGAGGFDPYAPNNANSFGPPAYGGMPVPGAPGTPGVPRLAQAEVTVIITNVPQTVALYDLWVLLEVYGNVNSLKRLYKDKSSVIAQFQHAPDAKAAVNYLNTCTFHGSPLGLKNFAGYVERGSRVEWNAGPATDPTTQAVLFTSGYHHRTRPTAPFNPLGRIRPDRNLFISNLLEDINDADVKTLIAQSGFEVEAYYRKNPTGAIVSFVDTDTAICVLVALHAKQMNDRYLRVTFSRYPPGPRPDGEAEDNEEGKEETKPAETQASQESAEVAVPAAATA